MILIHMGEEDLHYPVYLLMTEIPSQTYSAMKFYQLSKHLLAWSSQHIKSVITAGNGIENADVMSCI